MARRLFFAYVAATLGPLALASAAFALRDLLAQGRRAPPEGNGHAEAEGLEQTVEEARAASTS